MMNGPDENDYLLAAHTRRDGLKLGALTGLGATLRAASLSGCAAPERAPIPRP